MALLNMQVMKIVIYGLMAILVISAWGYWASLKKAGSDFEKAKTRIMTRDAGRTVEDDIRSGKKVSEAFFKHPMLRYKFSLFEEEIADTSKSGKGFTDCDIEGFFNSDLIDEIGHKSWCNFVSTALTALGILGTFFGLAFGVNEFALSDTDGIIKSIEELLSGMGFAFWTSIIGIAASLIFGFFDHTITTNALQKLNGFVDQFHKNVMDNETDNAFNEIIRELGGLEDFTPTVVGRITDLVQGQLDAQAEMLKDTCNTMIDLQRSIMEDVSHQFTEMMQAKMGTHFEELGEKVDRAADAYRGFSAEMSTAKGELGRVSDKMQGMSTVLGECTADAAEISGRFSTLLGTMEEEQRRSQEMASRSVQDMTRTVDAHTQQISSNMQQMLASFTQTIGVIAVQQQEAVSASNEMQKKALEEAFETQKQISAESNVSQSKLLEEQKKAAEEMMKCAMMMEERAKAALKATELQMVSIEQMQNRVDEMSKLVEAQLEQVRKHTKKGLFGFRKK